MPSPLTPNTIATSIIPQGGWTGDRYRLSRPLCGLLVDRTICHCHSLSGAILRLGAKTLFYQSNIHPVSRDLLANQTTRDLVFEALNLLRTLLRKGGAWSVAARGLAGCWKTLLDFILLSSKGSMAREKRERSEATGQLMCTATRCRLRPDMLSIFCPAKNFLQPL